jgi:hypothetical protein
MAWLKSIAVVITAYASIASSSPIEAVENSNQTSIFWHNWQVAALTVKLTPTGDNAVVHAAIKNTGILPVSFFKYGNLFHQAPVQKLEITGPSKSPTFFEV